MTANNAAKFTLGHILATPHALQVLRESGQTPLLFIRRHVQGDWGEVCEEDGQLNDNSLVDGSRILSAYRTLNGTRIWIITEAEDDQGHRPATTILLPEEY